MAKSRSGSKRKFSNRRARRRGGNSNIGWYLAIIVCIVLAIGVGFISKNLISKSKIDQATLCHLGGALNVTAILLDLTDPLNTTQQARLKSIMADEIAASTTDTMISLGIVSEDPANWGARFAKCKPETGEDANSLYENPTIIGERYAHEFTNPIQVTLQSMLTGEAENKSPIMEALQSLISETPNFTKSRGQRKIIIVSDMLQHSDNLSFYRKQGWTYFTAQNGIQRLAGNLANVTVEILRIPRSGSNIPSNDITEGFWSRYFDKQRARPPSVSSLGDL